MLDKVDFKLKLLKRDKEGHFTLIKRAVHQEEKTIINLYASNVSAYNFTKHTLKDLKPHTDPNTVVVGDINIPVSTTDRSSRQKKKKTQNNKEILEPNDTTDLMGLIQSIPSCNSTIHILLRSPQNFLQNRLCLWAQNKSQQI
jgi:hypothetical protein